MSPSVRLTNQATAAMILTKVGTTLRVLGEFVLFGKRKVFGQLGSIEIVICPRRRKALGKKDLNE